MIGSLPVFFSNFKNKLLRTVRYYMLPRLLSGGEEKNRTLRKEQSHESTAKHLCFVFAK